MVDTPLSVYIHIPFCKSKCNYCDFLSFPNMESLFLPYKNALLEEIKTCPELENACVKTVFFGGGTPTLLPAEYLCEILEELYKKNVRADAEITVECNPETVKNGCLPALKSAGVNRLSFGLQASQDRLLKKLGRIHTVESFENAYNEALRSGFSNINIDLMFSLPEQTLKDWEDTLEYTVSLNPTHISCYSLIIEEGTPFYEAHKNSELVLPDEETDREMYYLTNSFLKRNGYNRYEISNFSKRGFECEHNKVYWTRGNYIGLGLGSHSMINNRRFNNLTDLGKYINSNGNTEFLRQNFIEIDKNEAMSEFMFLGLRLTEGIVIRVFQEQFGESIFDVYGNQIKKLVKYELLKEERGRLRLTCKGVDLSNIVFSEFYCAAN